MDSQTLELLRQEDADARAGLWEARWPPKTLKGSPRSPEKASRPLAGSS